MRRDRCGRCCPRHHCGSQGYSRGAPRADNGCGCGFALICLGAGYRGTKARNCWRNRHGDLPLRKPSPLNSTSRPRRRHRAKRTTHCQRRATGNGDTPILSILKRAWGSLVVWRPMLWMGWSSSGSAAFSAPTESFPRFTPGQPKLGFSRRGLLGTNRRPSKTPSSTSLLWAGPPGASCVRQALLQLRTPNVEGSEPVIGANPGTARTVVAPMTMIFGIISGILSN